MQKAPLRNVKSLPIWVLSLFLTLCIVAQGRAADKIEWRKLKTTYTGIRYRTPEDLDRFDRMIRYPTVSTGVSWPFAIGGSKSQFNRVKKKTDAIFRRVQEILDMRKRVKRVTIHLYPDKEALHKAFHDIFKKECRLRAWYLYEYRTIYLNIKDLHEGMLAHEMAHHIINHYLKVRPPRATAEILARYVDAHLHPQ